MVKTRHSLETDEDPPDSFLTIGTRRTRDRNVQNYKEYDSDESGIVNFSPQSKRQQQQEHIDNDVLTEETDTLKSRRQTRKTSHALEDDDFISGTRSRRSTQGSAVKNELTLLNGDYDGVRRSGRRRKLVCENFNESLMAATSFIASVAEQSREDENRKKRRRNEVEPEVAEEEGEYSDIYSRVKRQRKQVKRDMYGIPIHEDDDDDGKSEEEEESSSSSDDEESDDEEEGENNANNEKDTQKEQRTTRRSYFLREHKPRTMFFEAGNTEPLKRKKNKFRDITPPRRKFRPKTYKSPAHRSPRFKRKRAAFHDNSSTSSSSSSSSAGDSSDDERRFERRKAKSMTKARQRCLPMNFGPEDVGQGAIRDRMKIGASLADVDPMNIDRSITFDSVGGLGKHVQALKEMVVFPLLYPEVFERFKIAPPRGVLFYGPPGTGKTLVARALANECSQGDRRVAFFMRKGADCLSKWVGESERQLRLLFDQAYQVRPSIIFFDEIDGLAPVRSSRQDQIHSSIVSTLLALMDGLDSRGEIVVIGATNRIDSIDPALRRPGRFDREFNFPLPSLEARTQILKIHTKEWSPKLATPFVEELAANCVGYCGADLKALCTEAALFALRRRYPQIYTSKEKLQLDIASIMITAKDFHQAMQRIVPAAQRAVTSPGRALSLTVRPLLQKLFDQALEALGFMFPTDLAKMNSLEDQATSSDVPSSESNDMVSDEDEDDMCIYESTKQGRWRKKSPAITSPQGPFLNFASAAYQRPSTHRPRLLLAGGEGQGQSSHLAPAILHHFERMPVHVLDLPSLFAVSAKTPEESCAQVFLEARRTSPSIIYVPHINQWWEVMHDTLRATFITMLNDLVPMAPILLLATSDLKYTELPVQVQFLFSANSRQVVQMSNPGETERREFFEDLFLNQACKPPTRKVQAALRALEVLPKAPPPEPRKLTERELKKLYDQEESTMRELRLFLRDVLNKLSRDRKFQIFAKPVDEEEVPDYYTIIKTPMDLSMMMRKIDLHHYQTVQEFLDDFDLICRNALEYNPETDPAGRAIRHRGCALRDTAHAIVDTELDQEFEQQCQEIKASRERRGEMANRNAPSYYHTRVNPPQGVGIPPDYPTRYSRRVRGMDAGHLSDVELNSNPVSQEGVGEDGKARAGKGDDTTSEPLGSVVPFQSTPSGDSNTTTPVEPTSNITSTSKDDSKVTPHANALSATPVSSKRISSSGSYKKNKSIWCRPSRRKHRYHHMRRKIQDSAEDVEEDLEDIKEDTQEQEMEQSRSSPETTPEGPKAEGDNNSDVDMTEATEVRRQSSRLHAKDDVVKESTDVLPPEVEVSKTPAIELLSCNDSGFGSAESRDSTEGPLKPENHTTTEAKSDTCEEMNVDDKQETLPSLRVTRSQLKQNQGAVDILEHPVPPLIVDKDRLRFLLELTVQLTQGQCVESLERLHSMLSQLIYNHRKDYDKTTLTERMETIVKSAA
ncbi:ATPase family AAA domain-containing protein 2 [Lingula anatina]|uniref:ATPase family AAA domain-containing protein 2 n=1 Tax=Lingula anatina TaxID=7574 RepID=A0A1S3JS91_LINAN|nr:ATPase family AAA domain-containing protein 2 [Lingula anatina]|eukprot:XP_013413245.1 ATPase family AAA domain-containing protein 2 [Lingula anatina]